MEHNKVVELGSLIKPAKTIRCGDDYYPVLSMTMHDGLVFQEEKFKKEVASKNKADYKVVFKNQLVVGFPIDEGVLATQRIVDAGIVSPAYGIWDVDQSKIHPEFLEWALRSARALDYYRAKLRGSTARRRSLPTETFLKFTLPLPSISEQMHILDIIHKFQVMLRSRQQQLAKLDELVKARFVEMFGGINESVWYPYQTIESFTSVMSGGTPDRNIPEYWQGNIRWIKTTELKNCIITDTEEKISQLGVENSSAKIIPANSILVAMYGQGKTRGMTGYITVECATNQACACILPSEKINQKYLWKYIVFSYDKLRSMAKGGNQPNLNAGIIRKFPVLMPPMNLQNRFAVFAEQVEKTKLFIQNSLKQMETLKKALIQQYFG